MGPTNLALLELFEADQALRTAQERLDAATRSLRVQGRRVTMAETAATENKQASMAARGLADKLQLDLSARDQHIEKLRDQQQNSSGNKEYQAFLVEINTQKEDRNKVEEQVLAAMGDAETKQAALATAETALGEEKNKLAELEATNATQVAELQAEVEKLQPRRDTAAEATPAAARQAFERLVERYDGEAMAPLEMPDARRMEYFCGACNRELMVDAYNRLAVRDAMVTCPSCDRLLFIPTSLTPEQAVPKKKKAVRKKAAKTASKKAARPVPTTLKPILSNASAESLREAEVRGTESVTCEVSVDGKAAGEFEAVSKDDFERRVLAAAQAQDVESKIVITSRQAGDDATAS
jgi:predicted  nucleic acid-binding Zn-ribbon protein